MLTIECITEIDDLYTLQPVWDTTLQKSEHNLLFLSYIFVSTEWENLGWELDREKKLVPFILLIKENDQILGFFPFVKERKTLRGFPVTIIRTLGHTYLDRTDMIITDKAQATTKEILHYFKKKDTSWDILLMQNILEDSSFVKHTTEVCKNNKFTIAIKQGYQSPYIRKNTSWPEYLKSRSKNFHKKMRNKTNRLTKNMGEIIARHYSSPEEIAFALQIAFDIDAKSWKAQEGTAMSSSVKSRSYWQSLSTHLSGIGQVRIWLLWINGQALAFEYEVTHNKKTYCLKWSYDKKYAHYSPGFLLKYKILEFLWQEDITEIEFLGTSDAFKEQWADKKKKHYNFYIFNYTFYSQAMYLIIFKVINFVKYIFLPHRGHERHAHD